MSLPERATELPRKDVESLSGWGNFPTAPASLVRPERFRELKPQPGQQIVRGRGRSYGDAALCTDGTVILTERLDRFLEFNENTGVLRAEAGATLNDILEFFVPKGWFVPVTPGTKYCSLGGCLAADVHGKNHHHSGTFSKHVKSANLILADGTSAAISPELNQDIFWATAGGMGLTGIVSEMSLQLLPIETAYIQVQHREAKNIDHALDMLSNDQLDDEYSVAWIDCMSTGEQLGRSVVMTGHHIPKIDLPLKLSSEPLPGVNRVRANIPFNFPNWALNPTTIKAFNNVYNWSQVRKRSFVTHFEHFFYPLDRIRGWNKMYGKRGFVQYQFVLPTNTSRAGMREILTQLTSRKQASFLAVLKRFGGQGDGLMSFPTAGFTLALDIPMNQDLLPLLDILDESVERHGGKQYLAKDSRLKAERIPGMYPRLNEFREVLNRIDPDHRFESDLSRRLELRK